MFPRLAVPFATLLALFGSRIVPADDAVPEKPETPVKTYPQLFLADADGGNVRLLLELGDYKAFGSPDWSEDGKTIAFDSWRPGIDEEFRKGHVFLVDADGKNPRDLGDGALPSLSPRGRRLVYSRYGENSGVWIANADGTQKTLIDAKGWSARWSPDGRRIAYTVPSNGRYDFLVHDIVEGDQHHVFAGTGHDVRHILWGFDWSPDGKYLAFKGMHANNEYFVGLVNADGAGEGYTVRFEGETSTHFGWQPDGKQVFMSAQYPPRKRRQLFTFDPAGKGEPELLAWQDPRRNNIGLVWSPDGKQVVFVSKAARLAKN